jgi:hypothetical protein
MKAILSLALISFFASSCKERPIIYDLGNGFSISGLKSGGLFKINKNASTVAEMELHDDYLVYTTCEMGVGITGHLSTPLNNSTGRGYSTLINFTGPDGKRECHQVIERRILGGDPDKDDVVIRAAVHSCHKAIK